MAKLSVRRRNKLKESSFAIPEERRYPINDRSHAANALARVSQHGTPEEKAKVKRAVCRRFSGMPTCKKK